MCLQYPVQGHQDTAASRHWHMFFPGGVIESSEDDRLRDQPIRCENITSNKVDNEGM